MADAQLPSIAEILAATKVLSSQAGVKVVKVRDDLVVKYGVRVSLSEARTMHYVSANSNVPIPKVYGAMTDPDNPNINYIAMEFVEGQCLDEIWSDLSDTEQQDVKFQLKAAVNSMRLMPDQGYIGSVGRRKCFDGVFFNHKTSMHNLNGPFANEKEMSEGILRGLALTQPLPSIQPLRTMFSNLVEHRIVFTHADLQARNILVRRGGYGTEEYGKVKLTLIDWEFSGWYPEYWEMSNLLLCNMFKPEWIDIVQDTMDVYTDEYLLTQTIHQSMFRARMLG